jgi:hypothetical protein
VSHRQANHAIAGTSAAVPFALWQTPAQATEMSAPIVAQRLIAHGNPKAARHSSEETKAILAARKGEAHKIQETAYGTTSGLWGVPHAVSLVDPFATVCGLPYLGGCQVPSIWDPAGKFQNERTTFEGLDIRGKCLGCAGAIGADPNA